jgi:hypothetical protein
MTIRDPETLASNSTCPSFNGASIWHMISKSSSSPVVLVTLGHINMILLFWQEGTKRQIKQPFKATEKTLIADGFRVA